MQLINMKSSNNHTSKVSGSPPLAGTGIVRLIVRDMNDHSPEFERQSYQATITENLPIGIRVLQPKATDKDAGANAKIRYTLLGEKMDRFRINSETGEITTAAVLDCEETSRCYFTLLAQDSSPTEPRATAVNLTIIILDVNDNQPNFAAASFNVNVPDRIKEGEFVFGARAVDLDDGVNALVAYNVSGKDMDKFSINMHTGVIRAKTELSNGTNSNIDIVFRIVMHARDQGVEPKSSVADLTVLLRPTKLFPTFAYMANTQFLLPEDVAEGTVITKLIANSPKRGDARHIRFAIAGGNMGEVVRIDASSGVLSVGRDGLDYEQAHQYEIWDPACVVCCC